MTKRGLVVLAAGAIVAVTVSSAANAADYVFDVTIPAADITVSGNYLTRIIDVVAGPIFPDQTIYPGDSVEYNAYYPTPILAPRVIDWFGGQDWFHDADDQPFMVYDRHQVIFGSGALAGYALGVQVRFEEFLESAVSDPSIESVTVPNPLGGDNPHREFFSGALSAPEPATWALVVLGFGAAGAALRRAAGQRFWASRQPL